jgi:hypothetical protein
MKKPWQMTRAEWLRAGRPTAGIRWSAERISQHPNLRRGERWELEAIRQFLKLLPKDAWRRGCIEPEPKTYLPDRDQDFAKSHWVMQIKSSIRRVYRQRDGDKIYWVEDAREAIILGRMLGYSEEDIAFYLVRNYLGRRV